MVQGGVQTFEREGAPMSFSDQQGGLSVTIGPHNPGLRFETSNCQGNSVLVARFAWLESQAMLLTKGDPNNPPFVRLLKLPMHKAIEVFPSIWVKFYARKGNGGRVRVEAPRSVRISRIQR